MNAKYIITVLSTSFLIFLQGCSKDHIEDTIFVDARHAITGAQMYDFEISTKKCNVGFTGDCDSDILDIKDDLIIDKDVLFMGANDYVQDIYFFKDDFHAKFHYQYLSYDYTSDTIHFSVKPLVNLKLEVSITEPLEYIEVRALEFFQENWTTVSTSSVPVAIQESDLLISSIEVGCVVGETISDNLFLNLPIVAEDSIRLYIRYHTEEDRYNQVDTLITGKGSSFESLIRLKY